MDYRMSRRPVTQPAQTGGTQRQGPRAVQLKALSDAVNAPVQRRQSFAQQTTLAGNVDYILQWTTLPRIASLGDRATFSANAAADLAEIANFAGYRAAAQEVQTGFGNVFAFNAAYGFSNYMGDGLDNDTATMQAHRDAIYAVREANTPDRVDQRKTAMMGAVAVANRHQNILDADNYAFRNAPTLPQAQAALNAWEAGFFTVSRPAMIQAAKQGAHNGGLVGASVWSGLSANVGGHVTHMTVYNANMTPFASHYVTRAATTHAASDALADHILPNGAGNMGVHLTAEVNPAGPNPRVFGNPPNAARYYNPDPAIPGNDFVGPLTNAQNTVRGYVWTLLDTKLASRP